MLSHLPCPYHRMHPQSFTTPGNVRTRSSAFIAVLLATCIVLLTLAPATMAAAQEATPLVVASGPLSERTLTLVGRTVQSTEQLEFFGYVNGAAGLATADLFTDGPDLAGSARLTFSADVTLEPVTNRADTSSFAGAGTLRIYLADGGASWENPASFSSGEMLAEYDLELRETLQRQAAQVGVLVGDGALTQSVANAFTLGDTSYVFGVEGLGQRLRYTGALTPDTAGTSLAAVVSGHVDVTDRDVTVVRLGQTTAPAATPTTTTSASETPETTGDCVLEPWLGNATSALSLADEGLSNLDLSAINGVDGDAVQDLADQIDAAIATQRESTPSEEGANANRLLVTALSTTSRGLRGIAQAVTNGDEAAFGQATAAISDGQTLLSQAQSQIADLAATCPAG